MTTEQQIAAHIATQPEPKRSDMKALHERILGVSPEAKLWFSDGRDSTGKVVANPTIGYGAYTIHYANGKTAESFRIGLSANTAGISVYVLGLADKEYLKQTFGPTLGKASVTGYCIRFKKLADIDVDVLMEAVQYGLELEEKQ